MKRLFLVLCLVLLSKAASIPTSNVDGNRNNSVSTETQLTPTNVTTGKFGLFGGWATDGHVFSQPLFVPAVTTSGVVHDLLIVVTMNNSVYAFDANRPGATVWSNLAFASPYASYPVAEGGLYGSLGCLSTPVVDVANSKLYVVCDTSTPNWVIRQLDLTTGSTLLTATISGQVVGTGDVGQGDTTSGANLLFYPRFEFQRAGLALANNKVYVAFGALNDTRPWHGWVFAYNTSDLSQAGIWCSTPNGYGGGVWMSGGAPAVDGSGNIYVTTGNDGGYDGVTNFSDSTVKLSPTLSVLDWFTPSNNAAIDSVDADVSANRAMLIPSTNFAIVAGKDFNVYLIDTTCMGHLQGSSGCSLQTFKTNAMGTPGSETGSYGGAFMNNVLYLPTSAGSIYAFTFGGSTFTTTPLATQTNSYGNYGPAQMFGSINGASNGILWVETTATTSHTAVQQGTLRALNPTTLAEYWNSGTSGQDALGNMTKFAAPVVTNGRIYVSTQDSKIQSYGLLPSSVSRGLISLIGNITQR